jgi:hypothetical protein
VSRPHQRWAAPAILGLLLGPPGLPGCSREVRPEVTAGLDACAHCNMVIDDVKQAAGWIQDREFVPFDNPGCLLAALEALPARAQPPPDALFFADFRDGTFYPAETMTFLLTSHRPTVMDGGALAFGSRAAAERARKHEDEVVTDWIGYRTARGTPDREVEVTLGPDGLNPERVDVDKGELVSWTVRSTLEEEERTIAVKGYPELEPARVAAGEAASFRLLALRPGSGFPIVEAGTDEVLGVLVVRGAHTADEEAEAP